jgi:hypothetical protein
MDISCTFSVQITLFQYGIMYKCVWLYCIDFFPDISNLLRLLLFRNVDGWTSVVPFPFKLRFSSTVLCINVSGCIELILLPDISNLLNLLLLRNIDRWISVILLFTKRTDFNSTLLRNRSSCNEVILFPAMNICFNPTLF